MTLSIQEITALDAKAAARHEVAHVIVASRWARSALVNIFPNPTINLKRMEEKLIIGQARYAHAKSVLDASAAGWAGVIGEILGGEKHLSFDDVFEMIEPEMALLSDTDLASIARASPVNQRRTARIAYDMLQKRHAELTAVAQHLADSIQGPGFACAVWNIGTGWNGPGGKRIHY